MSSTNVTKAPMSAQPQAAPTMSVTNAPSAASCQDVEHGNCKHKHGKGGIVSRLRGGGAGKDCFLGIIGCFLCFECCEGCCDCIGDIICALCSSMFVLRSLLTQHHSSGCPCEMCC
ncbi:uncharacterized protein C8R40DRAFT_1095901 [Lentinula edodes]|uniref:uncharacterized protein n=1 Tax=Lentinula edodes TaxID=5353 RepID=UPI001E8D6389|nr:uncharacterized protein C8R40DRAFT_1095901 [Lentinula edodes]KAH7877392.1 hypothetical protein C8R40DRAFT_1095901 [Lentinula edodes]